MISSDPEIFLYYEKVMFQPILVSPLNELSESESKLFLELSSSLCCLFDSCL